MCFERMSDVGNNKALGQAPPVHENQPCNLAGSQPKLRKGELDFVVVVARKESAFLFSCDGVRLLGFNGVAKKPVDKQLIQNTARNLINVKFLTPIGRTSSLGKCDGICILFGTFCGPFFTFC